MQPDIHAARAYFAAVPVCPEPETCSACGRAILPHEFSRRIPCGSLEVTHCLGCAERQGAMARRMREAQP